MASVSGPDFIGLQVRDVAASADFYTTYLGLTKANIDRPDAVVFDTSPIHFAVREPLPGTNLDDASPRPGVGVGVWLQADDAPALHQRLADAGVPIVVPITQTPFGTMFTFVDPDGYAITINQH